jgi:hypothetical protein
VLSSPILFLRAIKDIKKGEEIFAMYPLPQGVERLRQPLQSETMRPIIEGSVALEGDENYSTISPTDEVSDYDSEGEVTDEHTESTLTQSARSSPSLQSTHSKRPIFQPDPDASECIIL